MALPNNYYELLEVESEASQAEIRKAYARKLREYPVEQYPEIFQKIREAYETLSSEQEREKYDKSIRHDGKYTHTLGRAERLITERQYSLALTVLSDLLREFPGDQVIRFRMSLICLELGRTQESKSYLLQLIREDPNHKEYLHALIQACAKMEDWAEAAKACEKLIQLDPEESNYYLEMSYCYTRQGRYVSAAGCLETYLRRKDRETVREFPLLSELYFLALLQNRDAYRTEILGRIRRLPQHSGEKWQLLEMLINVVSTLENNFLALRELMELVETINQGEFEEVNDWLHEVQQTMSSHREVAAASETHPVFEAESAPVRGSIGMAIVIGIIFSFITTPIGGIIAGFVYYFWADSIVKLLKFIGCLILILIVIGIIIAVAH